MRPQTNICVLIHYREATRVREVTSRSRDGEVEATSRSSPSTTRTRNSGKEMGEEGEEGRQKGAAERGAAEGGGLGGLSRSVGGGKGGGGAGGGYLRALQKKLRQIEELLAKEVRLAAGSTNLIHRLATSYSRSATLGSHAPPLPKLRPNLTFYPSSNLN
jgi:hypothetical protein